MNVEQSGWHWIRPRGIPGSVCNWEPVYIEVEPGEPPWVRGEGDLDKVAAEVGPRLIEQEPSLNQPEPPPVGTDGVAVWPLVIQDLRLLFPGCVEIEADMQARDEWGRSKYGTPLRAHNGRDALVDAYQEALDLCVYLRQHVEELPKKTEMDHAILAEVHTVYSRSLLDAVRLGKSIHHRNRSCAAQGSEAP